MTILGIPEHELFASGHRACAGCGSALAIRHALKAAGKNTIVVQATGCMEVVSTPFPETSWMVPYIHVAFENAAAVASGVDTALKKQGKRETTNVLVFGGDGGTFDIGIQAISGAMERGQRFCYVCNDNGGYMNTGIQRSGATPKYAATTTSPAGKKIGGKTEYKKDMPFIIAAHGAYVATANIAFPQDLVKKVQKGLSMKGPAYIQVFSPCPTGWKTPSDQTINISKLAYQTNIAPLFEIEDGVVKITREPSKKTAVLDYLKTQGRFKHLKEDDIADVQKHIDERWERIKKLAETGVKLS
ncbi:MAG: pyruvate synthase subunit beta [bacterium]|nr:pyruvate synthase subunit beta [bacterium]